MNAKPVCAPTESGVVEGDLASPSGGPDLPPRRIRKANSSGCGGDVRQDRGGRRRAPSYPRNRPCSTLPPSVAASGDISPTRAGESQVAKGQGAALVTPSPLWGGIQGGGAVPPTYPFVSFLCGRASAATPTPYPSPQGGGGHQRR